MATRRDGKPDPALLREGLKSYFDVMIAAREFCRELQALTSIALRQELRAISGALKTRLSATAMKPFVSPSMIETDEWDDESVCIGSYIHIANLGTLNSYVWWERANDGSMKPTAIGSLEVDTRKSSDALWELLAPTDPSMKYDTSYRELYLLEPIIVSKKPTSSPARQLRRPLKTWARVFRQFKGLHDIRKLTRTKEERPGRAPRGPRRCSGPRSWTYRKPRAWRTVTREYCRLSCQARMPTTPPPSIRARTGSRCTASRDSGGTPRPRSRGEPR